MLEYQQPAKKLVLQKEKGGKTPVKKAIGPLISISPGRNRELSPEEANAVLEGITKKAQEMSLVAPVEIGRTHALAEEINLAENLVGEVAKTSPDVNVLCGRYGLRREELGRLTGFSLRALADWAAGKLPSQPALRRLHEVRRLLDGLAQIVPSQTIPEWLRRRNSAFGNLTPLQVIEVGEIDRLWAMVHERNNAQ